MLVDDGGVVDWGGSDVEDVVAVAAAGLCRC